MTTFADGLTTRWLDLCGALGVPSGSARAQAEVFVTAYSEEHRVYHDLRHLAEVFEHVDTMVDLSETDRRLVELALWFHDLVYEPTASDNEARSAGAAVAWMRAEGVDRAEDVAKLIEMTAGHHVVAPTDAAAAVHDADLAILGAPEQRYDQYARQIRAEYAHVPESDFAVGRRRVLESFAQLDVLYLRPDIRTQREEQARANIARELAAL